MLSLEMRTAKSKIISGFIPKDGWWDTTIIESFSRQGGRVLWAISRWLGRE